MLKNVRAPVLLFLLATMTACVERRLWVRTDPKGAAVRINGRDVGRSPVGWRFDHYGTVLVEAELAGHEPIQKEVRLKSPWDQKPVIDFFADVLVPIRIRDDHEVKLQLEPSKPLTAAQVERAIRELRTAARKARAEANRKPPAKKKPGAGEK